MLVCTYKILGMHLQAKYFNDEFGIFEKWNSDFLSPKSSTNSNSTGRGAKDGHTHGFRIPTLIMIGTFPWLGLGTRKLWRFFENSSQGNMLTSHHITCESNPSGLFCMCTVLSHFFPLIPPTFSLPRPIQSDPINFYLRIPHTSSLSSLFPPQIPNIMITIPSLFF